MNHPPRPVLPRPPSLVRDGDDARRPTPKNPSENGATTTTHSPTVTTTGSVNGLVGNLSPTWRRDNTTLSAIINRALTSTTIGHDGAVSPPSPMGHHAAAIPQSLPDPLSAIPDRPPQLPPLPLWNDEDSKDSESEDEPAGDNGIIIPSPEIDGYNESIETTLRSPSRLTGNHRRHRKILLVGLGTVFLLTILGVSLGVVLSSESGGIASDNDKKSTNDSTSPDDSSSGVALAGKTCPVSDILKGQPSTFLNNVTVNGNTSQQDSSSRGGAGASETVTTAHDWMEKIATWLTPYFPDEEPCFPVSDAHIETLVWMMERIMTNQGKSSFLSKFDAEAWLQVFVVSLLARTWGVAGDPPASSNNNNNNNNGEGTTTTNITTLANATTTVVVEDDEILLLNPFVAASPLHLCKWKGIRCNGEGRLMSLQWNEPSMDLKGTIPSELALLSNLIFLDLSYSPNLVGSIPRSVSPQLRALYLEHTGVAGPLPSELVSLTDLRISFTPRMQQHGLPSFLHQLTQLKLFEWRQQVDPRSKSATSGGTIPTELGHLTQLKALNLDGNGFSGTVPTEIGLLTMLENLDLAHNNLKGGSLPTEVGLMTRLEWLTLEDSGLQGSLPMELTTLPQLQSLDVGGPNNDFDRETMARIFDALPMDCVCGTWFQSREMVDIESFLANHRDEDLTVIPYDCGCSVLGRDGR